MLQPNQQRHNNHFLPRFGFGKFRTLDSVQRGILSAPQERGRRDFSKAFIQTQRFFKGSRADAEKYVLLLTGGNSQVKARRSAGEAKKIKAAGIKIAAVGVGVQNEGEIDTLVTDPADDHKFLINDAADLAFMSDVVYSTICT